MNCNVIKTRQREYKDVMLFLESKIETRHQCVCSLCVFVECLCNCVFMCVLYFLVTMQAVLLRF